jgi:hypothetical protein
MERIMRFKLSQMLVGISLVTGLMLWESSPDLYAQSTQAENQSEFCGNQLHGEVFARTELFFGLSKPDRSTVTEAELKTFIDQEVTPRFPDGLTLLTGTGQFKDSTGKVVKEESKLLILIYPFSRENEHAIEQIRQAYIQAFQQESVLRVDGRSCVSF